MKTCMGSEGTAPLILNLSTGVPPYPQVICSKTYFGYQKPQIIPNAIYNVIFM
jgi:hypothetical protein